MCLWRVVVPAGAVEVVKAILNLCWLVDWVAECKELVGPSRLGVGSLVCCPNGVARFVRRIDC